ncbi:uncharacterized protein LOC6616603 isoform X1 [Drosophila sechellia]|uniref:Uncharacterized protein, isoform A n=4 Tax=melanogaster subgroup TaxID=32351 RepID=A0A0J9S1H4_DROSI|nr:uncharacterized protein LOC6616603 isoform X1 [Drosophila sechellia]XP_016033006.1 uncharacterized protein LOC6739155 isoform X1 [Drosophila simulans]XP_033159434.1 uncharacterized protein LOC117140549 isoform X1 [Drosophila mauritiana]KMZ01240.1 uncharacterized protein Dsimw501_GD15056, isoform A [Drosophila simulans]
MKLLGLGAQVLRLKTGGQSRSAKTCPPEVRPPSPCCPKKRFWTFKRVICFSTLTFGAGVYTGIYVSQNYEVPRVDDPQKLVQRFNEKLKELMDQTKNKSPGEKLVDDIKKEAKKILDD